MKKLLGLILAVLLAVPSFVEAKIFLADTDDTLRVVTASGVSTIHMYAAWADITTTALTPGASDAQVTTATTTVLVAAPGASTQRQIKGLSIANAHASSSNVVTVEFFDGATATRLIAYTLLAGETLQWGEDVGFRVLDASGQVKSAVVADTELPAAAALADNTSNPTTTGLAAYMMCYDGSTWDRCLVSPNVAHDADASAANPLLIGCYSSAAAPTDVTADTENVRAWCLRNGARATQPTFAGVLASAGNGVSGTGVQRVTIASDSTGVVGLASGTPASLGVYVEDAAETAGGNLSMAGTVRRDTAASSAGTTGDNSTLNTDQLGRLWTRDANPCSDYSRITHAVISESTAATNEIVALNGSDLIYVCSYKWVTTAANSLNWTRGTGTDCATGTTAIEGAQPYAANGGVAESGGGHPLFVVPAGNALCLVSSAATAHGGRVSYVRTAAP